MCPKRYKYSGLCDYQTKLCFLLNGTSGIPGGTKEGSKSGWGALAGSQGALGKSDLVHWSPSAKVNQGFNFNMNAAGFSTVSFFALDGFWNVLTGSWERGERQRRRPRAAMEKRSPVFGCPEGPAAASPEH